MYTLHIANKNYSSWSLRPWVLMKVLEIPFAERLTPFPVGPSWSLFRSFSPGGRVPALHEGDTVVWDSLAITEYLAERHEGVWATGPKARAWSRSASAASVDEMTMMSLHSCSAAQSSESGILCQAELSVMDCPRLELSARRYLTGIVKSPVDCGRPPSILTRYEPGSR